MKNENDLQEWRGHARELLLRRRAPDDILWRAPSDAAGSLFAEAREVQEPGEGGATIVASRRFIQTAERVICHRDPTRFDRLYRVLWRLQQDRRVMDFAADDGVSWLRAAEKSVQRDMHKMKAFVRFRRTQSRGPRESYVAWFEPQHRIVELAAPFFMRRFTGMDWTILTPDRSARWDGRTLSFGIGATRDQAPTDDAVEEQWKAYFASIFNPARLKIKAMTTEMPKKYWKNLPEADLIPNLIAGAKSRTAEMRRHAVTEPNIRASKVHPHATENHPERETPTSLGDVARALTECRRCPLFERASRAVMGEGPERAELMIVGEQPGDQEDLAGKPFVGPAGAILNRALEAAEIDRDGLYLTNAVKHFKFVPRGKRRLHQRPNAGEIEHCRWWLKHEIKIVRPALIVALGATATRGVLGRPLPVKKARGQTFEHESGSAVRVTVHPSYLLRLPDTSERRTEFRRFVADLVSAKAMMTELSEPVLSRRG